MGNDLTNEDEHDREEDVQNENIKFGLISKKYEEKSNEDSYVISPNIKISEGKTSIEYSLFGVFDGHNSNHISKYLSKNINTFFEKELGNLNEGNYQKKIEDIFKEIDKSLRTEKNNNKDEKNYINSIDIEVNNREKEFIKNSINNSGDIPEDLKEIDDNEINDLLAFKNLFDYNHNFFNNKNNLDYIGSSASLVLITQETIIKMELGITKCFLFDEKGKILNSKINETNANTPEEEEINIIKDHKFENEKEKKRIKKFNKDIDYESLKMNPYIPASRSFGFFKYKENELLNEKNQIISCIPDIEKYDKEKVDFIFLITGTEIGLESQKKLSEKIKQLSKRKNEDIKYTKLIEELLKDFHKEKTKSKIERKSSEKESGKIDFNLYFGKDNIEEENIIIDGLDGEYYKDVLELNNSKNLNKRGNTTCILIKLNKKKDKNEIIAKNIKIEKEEEKGKEGNKSPENKIESKEDKQKEENKDNK